MTAVEKRLFKQTPVGDAVVVTARYADGAYETWVMGGKLDGWVVPSSTLGDAKATHCGAVQLVRESVELAEVR